MDSPDELYKAVMVAVGFLAAAFFRFSKMLGNGLDDDVKGLINDIDHRQSELEKCLATFMAEVRGKFELLNFRLDAADDERNAR